MNCVGLLVGDLDAELLLNCQRLFCHPRVYGYANLLNCHHNLNGVQAVKTKVVGEVRGGSELHNRLAVFRLYAVMDSYFRRVGNLGKTLSVLILTLTLNPSMYAHLVEVLEEIQNTAGNLLLVEAGASGVAPDGGDAAHRRNCPGGGERRRDGAAEGRSGVGPGADLGGSTSAADDGGAEHGGGNVCDGADNRGVGCCM